MPQTMHCPRCQSTVGISDDAAGTRVRCPQCEQEFTVPGIAASTSDDDDWLTLDPVPPPADDAAPVSSGPQGDLSADDPFADSNLNTPADVMTEADVTAPSSAAHAGGGDDSPFGFSLDDFTAGTDAVPAPATGQAPAGDSFLDGLPPVDDSPPPPAAGRSTPAEDLPGSGSSPVSNARITRPTAPVPRSNAPLAQPAEYASEYRVKCPICGSIMYVKADQSGRQISCTDCHTGIKVPPPPKIKQSVKIDVSKAEVFGMSEVADRSISDDPFRKSATALLEEAEQLGDEEPEPDFEVPKIGEWVKGVVGIFAQPSVVVYWLSLSMAGSLFGGIVALAAESLVFPVLLMSVAVGSLFFGAAVVACGFAILTSVANDEDQVTDWPISLEPTEWMSTFVMAIAAALTAIVPAYALGSLVGFPHLAIVAFAMLAVYITYPFVLLSMLDMQSMFTPFSPEVARSVTRCQESWGGFYFSSGVLFFGTFLVFVTGSLFPPAAAVVVSVFIGVAAAFMYFAMLGRLAYAIGQAVNEKPRVNDIDRSRPTDNV